MKSNSPWVTLLKGISIAMGLAFLMAVMLAAGPSNAPRTTSGLDAGARSTPEYFPATKAGPMPRARVEQQQAVPSKR